MEHTTIVGIDVSKEGVHVLPSGEAWAALRDGNGLAELCPRLGNTARVIAVEATGGYEAIVAATLSSHGLPVIVVNPAQVRAFAHALGKQAKTDPIDAQVIVRFAEATRPHTRPLPDRATRMLADLVARRRQIVQMIVAECQRLHRTEPPRVRKSITRLLKALEKELASVDHDIDGSVRGSPVWREKQDLLASVLGIIARTLLPSYPSWEHSITSRWQRLPASSVHSPIWGLEGQDPDRRRSQRRAHRAVHRRSGRQAMEIHC